jgi:hypothetical protein
VQIVPFNLNFEKLAHGVPVSSLGKTKSHQFIAATSLGGHLQRTLLWPLRLLMGSMAVKCAATSQGV